MHVIDDPFDGGRRFFRCPYSGVNCFVHVTANTSSILTVPCSRWRNATLPRWIDPPHERHVVMHVDTLWNRIFDLEAQIDDLKEQNDGLRQQMHRERGNKEVVNIGSFYDPTCYCANPSCICACHYNDG